jgi:hypothetical protein
LRNILKRGEKKSIGNIYCFLMLLFCVSNLYSQQTNNLQVIWVKTAPESVWAYGRDLASGDINNDGYSDIAIIGDSMVDLHGAQPYRGKCWIFYGGPDMDTIPDIILQNYFQSAFSRVYSVDINSDGYSDVFLGASANANGYGEILVYLGGNPMDTICDYMMKGYEEASGFCFPASGDLNGDGYQDLIVGAPGWRDCKGRVYIFFGGPNFDTIPDVILNGGHHNDYEMFGYCVSGSGDINNDGFSDVIIGAISFGIQYQGRIYIYFGGNPMDTSYDVAMMGEGYLHDTGGFGVDFIKNYQDFDCAIFGTPYWGPTGPNHYNPGKMYLLKGGNLIDSVPDLNMVGRTEESALGFRTSSAGDVNGDLCDDIISGAVVEDSEKGVAYLWLGGTLLDTIPDAWLSGELEYDYVGAHVKSAGDINSDGRDEVLIGNCTGGTFPERQRVWICKYTGLGTEDNHLPTSTHRFSLNVFPNPAKNYFTVRLPQSADHLQIKIFDVSGKVVREILNQLQNDNTLRVSLDGIKNGIYFVKIDNNPQVTKIIVTK